LKKPYKSIITSMLNGLEDESPWPVKKQLLNEESSIEENPVETHECKASIGLGSRGASYIKNFANVKVIGSILKLPEDSTGFVGMTLTPSPCELFKRLKHFSPNTIRVHVIYNPKNNQDLIDYAAICAKNLSLELVSVAVNTVKRSALKYKELLAEISPIQDSIWLNNDASIFDTKAILPLILKESWDRDIVVFSSQAAHVKYGALFSVYPDNEAHGKELARLAYNCASSGCPGKKISYLDTLNTALNIKTAAHLNLRINRRNDRYVTMTFPQGR